MNQFEKNEILAQIGKVLEFCHKIVAKLSTYDVGTQFSKETPIEDEDDEMRKFIETEMSRMKGSTTTTVDDNDGDEDVQSDRVYGERKMTKDLIRDDCSDSSYGHASGSSSGYGSNVQYDGEEDRQYGRHSTSTPLQRWPTYVNITEVAKEPLMSETTMKETENVLMESVLQFLHDVTPDAIYHPNWREELKRKAIHPEFYNLWTSYDAIFSDVKDDSVDIIKVPAPDNIYHTIDIFNVNQRFIENIPKPNSYPVLGVSQDPDFYHKSYGRDNPTKSFLSSFPHGALSGYETNLGIVAPPTDPIHGYIWSDHFRSFVLHAVRPGEGSRSRRRG